MVSKRVDRKSNASEKISLQLFMTNESPYTHHEITPEIGNFCTKSYEKVLLASVGANCPSSSTREQVAIRIRHSSGGYAEWMNELHCYLLPNFKHKNILEYCGSGESHKGEGSKFCKLGEYIRLIDDKNDPRARETIRVVALPKHAPRMEAPPPTDPPDKEPETTTVGPFRVEYWLMTKFCDSSMTLRDYLIGNTLTWPQMIKLTRGIMKGLYFLHENHEYQSDLDHDNLIDSFIDSTNGAIRRVAFRDPIHVIHMKPHLNLTIVHRNLCSKNIVIKRNLTPCIWNFGQAYIHHPFQPTNGRQLIDDDTKRMQLLSQYSSPEVLQEKGHLSLAAMKSIDMYASGIIMWELISRCVLPKLIGPTSHMEDLERQRPDDYIEPMGREFGRFREDPLFTDNVVCSKRIRPRLKIGWLIGKKTYGYVKTMKELWDPDFDARLHPATVIGRLNCISLTDRDRRNKYFPPLGKVFLAETTNWPNEDYMKAFQAPIPADCQPNKVLDDYTDLPASRRPNWLSSSSSSSSNSDSKI